MNTTSSALPLSTPAAGKPLRAGLWAAQVLLAIGFGMSGFMKLTTPYPELVAMMKWPGDFSPEFVRFIGVVDLLGGIGILLPSLTRVWPRLSVLAALGCCVLQLLAIALHVNRGEPQVLPLNFVLLALSLFVLWGRERKAPIAPRGSAG